MAGDDDIPSFFESDHDGTRLHADIRLGRKTSSKPWLVVVGGRRSVGMLFEVKARMTLGRSQPADVALDEEGVSRKHALVELLQGGVVRVTDLGSSNGIRVGGRLVKSHALRDGERMRLGDAVLTLLHLEDEGDVLVTNLRSSADAIARAK